MSDTDLDPRANGKGRRRWTVPLLVLGVLLLAGAGGLYWFLSDDAPSEVDLEATAAAINETTSTSSTASPSGSTTEPPVAAGIEGEWVVDTTIGDFTVEADTTATFVGFRVDEELSGIGATTAVGRTPAVSGSMRIAGTIVESVEVVADMTSIVSDESRRNGAIQRALNTGENPDALFSLSEPIELGDGAADGEIVTTTASGQLTVNGITNDVVINIEAQMIGEMILITGTTDVVFADYGITAPTAPIVLSVEDNGIVEFQLWMTR